MQALTHTSKLTTLGAGLILTLTTGFISTGANADNAEEIRVAQSAKISLKQAVDIAQKQAKGNLVDVEFDNDDSDAQGASGVYELEFNDGNNEYEIKVDAITGQVVDSDTDSLDSGDQEEYDIQQGAKIGIMAVIDAVEDQADSQVLEIKFKNNRKYADHPTYYEVDTLKDDQIIELKINAETGRQFERRIKY